MTYAKIFETEDYKRKEKIRKGKIQKTKIYRVYLLIFKNLFTFNKLS